MPDQPDPRSPQAAQQARHHVEPGGPAAELRLAPGLEVVKVSVGPMDNNAYLVTAGSETVLVDAPADPARLLEVIGTRRVTAVVTTHRHHDHVGALAEVATATGAPLFCGAADLAAVESATGTRQQPLEHGDTVPLAGLPGSARGLAVIGLRGHTPGSVALVLPAAEQPAQLFSGDSLFPGGPGKTAGRIEFDSLLDDLEARVFQRLGEDTVVHPGHGDGTTLGIERPQLSQWRARGW